MAEFEWWMIPVAFCLLVWSYALFAWLFPVLLDPLAWLLMHGLTRFNVYGRDRVPATGPALIVCNHVSYLDWLMLWVASPRPLTFVLYSGFRKNAIVRFFLSYLRHRTIWIDNRSTAPHAVANSLEAIAGALAQGRAVLLFPEGRLTRNGQMRPFHRGIELILRQCTVPVAVVPTCLWNVWGMLLTHKDGKVFWRWPEVWRRRIAVCFGQPMPGNTPTAEIRAAVVETSAECGQYQSEYTVPVHSAFVRKGAMWSNLLKTAFVDVATGTERLLTWPKALVGAWALSSWFKKNLGPEQNVGVWLPTGLGSAFTNIALAFQCKTSVNLNYTAGTASVHAAIKQANVKTVITAKRFTARIPLELPPDVKRIDLEDALAGITSIGKLWRLLAVILLPGWFLDRFVLRLRRFGWDEPLTIIFSSGSTGDPKGVMLSLRNISANADGFQKGVNISRRDVMMCSLPYFHSFGFTVCLWAPASIGMMLVFYPDPRAAKEMGELVKRWKCSIFLSTATFLRFYLRRCEPDDFRSVRLLVCGAEKLPVSLALEFEERFKILPYEGYGCTELSPVVGANLPDFVGNGANQKANTPGSIGQPIPGVVVKAFDAETREPLRVKQEGIICVKGANVMLGYLNQPEKTAEVIQDGWYWTGDMGYITPEGFVTITGRLSRFAKIAGEMIPLERVEDEVHSVLEHSGERQVALAAVPDAKRGERLVVLHLPDVGVKLRTVFETLRKRGLPNLWIPDERDCHVVEAFPVLGSGKLDLRGLVELAKKLALSR